MGEELPRTNLERLLADERAPAAAAAIAALLSAPSLVLGEFMDDHLLRERARRGDPIWAHMDTGARGSVAWLREHGDVGWWASDEFRLVFMRPLSGLSHRLDYLGWPRQLWLMHAENVLLYTLCILVLGRVLRELFGAKPVVVGLACLLFAIDELHAASVAWIAGRNTLLAALLGLVALLAHLRWRGAGRGTTATTATTRPWVYGLGAGLSFAAALLAAEAGLAVFGYIVAWALVRERGWARLSSLLPYLGVIVAWRLAYVALGFGVSGSTIYVDPAAAPLEFVFTALVRAPALSFAALSLPLTDLMTAAPASVYVLALGFAALAWALAPLLRGDAEDHAAARVLLLGMLAVTVPFAATSPSSRTMLILGPGSAGLVALAWTHRAKLDGRVRRGLVSFMLGCQLILAPLLFVPVVLAAPLLDGPSQRLADAVDSPTIAAPKLRVVVNAPSEMSLLYPRAIRANAGLDPGPPTYVLFAGLDAVEVERVGQRSLELRAADGWAASHIDRFSRNWAREAFAVGELVELELARVEVVEVEADGRPTHIRVDFGVALDDVELLAFDGRELVGWRPRVAEPASFAAKI